MKILYPDYSNCLTNLANSIAKKFGVYKDKEGLKLIEPYLQKDYENIVVLVLDAMGKNIIDANLKKDGFFHSNLIGVYSSVFPPTTVAATTSLMSGMNPCEHSWLGWDCYFSQIDKNVVMFFNTEQFTDKPAAEFNVPYTYCSYEGITSKIRCNGGKAFDVAPFLEPYPKSFKEMANHIKEICKEPGQKYIYSYWNEPDSTMHAYGCFGAEAKAVIQTLEKEVEELCDELMDTLIIITADHGHIDSEGVALEDYPKIMDCLKRLPTIEPRTLSLYIKDGRKEEFKEEWNKEFGDKFVLWTKEEVIDKKLFGVGVEHDCFRGMLGDYIAIGVDNLSIFVTKEEVEQFKGAHAGLNEDEMLVPLIVIEK